MSAPDAPPLDAPAAPDAPAPDAPDAPVAPAAPGAPGDGGGDYDAAAAAGGDADGNNVEQAHVSHDGSVHPHESAAPDDAPSVPSVQASRDHKAPPPVPVPVPREAAPSVAGGSGAGSGAPPPGTVLGACPLTVPSYRMEGDTAQFLVNVQTHTYHATAERTYEQFEQFDAQWRAVYPNVQYPLGGGGGNSNAPDFLMKRAAALQTYLHGIYNVAALKPDIAEFVGVDVAVFRAYKPPSHDQQQHAAAASAAAAAAGAAAVAAAEPEQAQWDQPVPSRRVSVAPAGPRPASASTVVVPRDGSLSVVQDPAAHLSPLPEPWTFQTTPEGHVYFWNSVTGESVWTRPVAEPAAAPAPPPPPPTSPPPAAAAAAAAAFAPAIVTQQPSPTHAPAEPPLLSQSQGHYQQPAAAATPSQAHASPASPHPYHQPQPSPTPAKAGQSAQGTELAPLISKQPETPAHAAGGGAPAAAAVQQQQQPQSAGMANVAPAVVVVGDGKEKPQTSCCTDCAVCTKTLCCWCQCCKAPTGPPPPPTEWTGIQEWEMKEKPCCLLYPYGAFHVFRTVLLVLIILYNNTVVPFRMAFGFGHVYDRVDTDSGQTEIETGVGLLVLLDWLTDAWRVVEVGLNFRTAYVGRDGLLVVCRKDIEWHYLTGWFVLDAVSIIPFDLIQTGTQTWMPWIRIFKMVQIARVFHLFDHLDSSMAVGLHILKLRAVRLFLVVFFLVHDTACLYFGLNAWEGFGTNAWTLDPAILLVPARAQYLHSVHWTLSTFTGVREGVFPITVPERLFGLLCLAIGIVLLAFILEHIRFVATVVSHRLKRHRTAMQALGTFLAQNELSEKLHREVMDYYQYWWSNTHGIQSPDQEICTYLPVTGGLRAQSQLHTTPDVCEEALAATPLFKRCSVSSDPKQSELLSDLIGGLVRVMAVSGEYVVRMDEPIAALYIVYRGEAQVLVGLNEKKVATLKSGQTFGEQTLCHPAGAMRLGALRASSSRGGVTDFYVLTRKHLEQVLALYPDESKVIAGCAQDGAYMNAAIAQEKENTAHAPGQLGLQAAALLAAGDTKDGGPAAYNTTLTGGSGEGGAGAEGEGYTPLTNTTAMAAPPSPSAAASSSGADSKAGGDSKAGNNNGSGDNKDPKLARNRYTRSQRHIHRMNDDRLLVDGASSCILHPLSRHRRNWELLCTLVILYQVLSIPYRMAFAPTSTNPGMLAAAAFCDIVFLLDILFRFRLGYINSEGETITNPCYVCAHYVTGWLLLHLLAIFPADWLILAQRGTLYTWLSCNRFLRIADLFRADRFSLSLVRSYAAVQLLELVGVTLLLVHVGACIFWSYTSFETVGSSAFIASQALADDNISTQYLYSFYVAATHLIGHGATLLPETDEEFAYAICLMVASLFLVPYLIGNIGALIGALSASELHWQETTLKLLQYHTDHDAPSQLYDRIRRHQLALHQLEGGIHTNAIVQKLPRGLRNDVLAELCTGVVRAVPLFRHANPRFLLRVIHSLQFESHSAGEWIVRAGKTGRECVWISRGFVEIFTTDEAYAKLRTVVSTNPDPHALNPHKPQVVAPPRGPTIAVLTKAADGTEAAAHVGTDGKQAPASPLAAPTSVVSVSGGGGDAKEGGAPGEQPQMVTISVPVGSVTSVVAVAPPPPPPPAPVEPPKPPTVHILGRGEFFTGLGMFTGVRTNRFDAQAKSACHLLVLGWRDWNDIVKDFPDVRADMETLQKQRGTLAFG